MSTIKQLIISLHCICFTNQCIAEFLIDSVNNTIINNADHIPTAQQSPNIQNTKLDKSNNQITLVRVENTNHYNPFSAYSYLGSSWDLSYDSLIAADNFHYGRYLPLIASDIKFSPDQKGLRITINEQARFMNQKPITSDDIICSINHLTTNGQVIYHALQQQKLTFTKLTDKELSITSKVPISIATVIQIGLLPITEKISIHQENPTASGAYQLTTLHHNRYAQFKKNQDYWASHLKSRADMYQFEHIKIIFMKTRLSAFEAFKRHEVDYRWEDFHENWSQIKQLSKKNPKIKTKTIPQKRPIGMIGFAFNLHRSAMKNAGIREALNSAFNFTEINESIFNSQYMRVKSYFTNTPYANPSSKDGTFNLDKAEKLLSDNGYHIDQGIRKHKETNKPFVIKILVDNAGNEKIANIYGKNLRALGIQVTIHKAISADYLYRLQQGDFDLAYYNIPITQQSAENILTLLKNIPGNNYSYASLFGIQENTSISSIQINNDISVKERQIAMQKLDQHLMKKNYFIPFWHPANDRIAYWDNISGPDIPLQLRPVDNYKYWWPEEPH